MKELCEKSIECIRKFPHFQEEKLQEILLKNNYENTVKCLEDLLEYVDYLNSTDHRMSDEYFMKKYNLGKMEDCELDNLTEDEMRAIEKELSK